MNYSKLANVDTPKGSGNKSSSHRKASQKQSMKQVKQILQESSGEHTYHMEPSYPGTNEADKSFYDEDSSQHMTEGFCDIPAPLYSLSLTPSLLKTASPIQSRFPSTLLRSIHTRGIHTNGIHIIDVHAY